MPQFRRRELSFAQAITHCECRSELHGIRGEIFACACVSVDASH